MGQVAHRLGDVGVVALLAVGGADGGHGADVADARSRARPVEAPQDEHAPAPHPGEPTPGRADVGLLHQIERGGFPGHHVPQV